MRAPALLLALLAATVVVAPAAADVSGPDIVGFLNAQRAAQGIPAAIVEDPTLSDGCAKHDAYGRLNNVLTHGEDPALPGYTAAGDQAGRTSVLYAGGGPWSASADPFETAPIHLHQLLAPRLDRMGAAEVQSWGCATTLASRNRAAPATDQAYTYPGDGATAWPPSQVAEELPYTPGEKAGIPAGTRTGPYLYVMFDGPDLETWDTAGSATATLTGPGGPVDVAVVDNTTAGLTGYLPTGMEVIPRRPLEPTTTYTASVSAQVSTQGGAGPARAFARTWSFTTGLRPNAVFVSRWGTRGRTATVHADSDAPGATLVATGPGTTATAAFGADGDASVDLDAPGTWQLCARSGGGSSGYVASEDCVSVAVAASVFAPVVPTNPGTTTTTTTPPSGTTATSPGPGTTTPGTGGSSSTAEPTPLAVVSASGVRARLAGRSLTLTLRCSAACRIRASGSLQAGRVHGPLKAASASRGSAGPLTLKLKVPASTARRLRHRGGRRAVLTLAITSASGRHSTMSVTRAV